MAENHENNKPTDNNPFVDSLARITTWVGGLIILSIVILYVAPGLIRMIPLPFYHPAPRRHVVAPVKANQRSMATALESYYIDYSEYPAWIVGEGGANSFLPPDSPSYNVPTFRIKDSAQGTHDLHTLTTPITYVTSYLYDPFVHVNEKPVGATFGYWTDDPKNGGWIIWSPGPDGIYDINPQADYDSTQEVPSESLYNKTYDPTNGTNSRGDIWRVKT